MTVLIVSSVTPTLRSGGGVRTYGVIAALARHQPVDVAYVVFGAERPAAAYDALERVSTRPLHASRGARRALAFVRARARGVPGLIARGVSPELERAARGTAPSTRIVADGPVAAAVLLPLAKAREVAYLAHNLESAFRTEWGRGDLRSFERKVLQAFSEIWLPTRADIEGAIALGGERVTARYVPNVVDTSRIEPVAPAGAARILFVADFTYDPNREGLGFLVERVMPLVWERRPDAGLMLVGRGLTKPPADPRIEALGLVEDLRSAYAAADAVAVPLLRGGGSPLKFIEALAYGLPVVATAHAARLLEEGSAGEHFLAASTAAEFAKTLDRVLADRKRARELGAAGRELAVRRYSVDTLAAILALT